jgi:hypothetical protein
LLHVPGVLWHTVFCVAAVHSVPAGLAQVPAAAQGTVVLLQAAPVRLHVPPRTAQLGASGLHESPSLLQWPIAGQGPEQLAPVMLHTPGWGGHAGSLPWIVQRAPVRLHVPGLGVHTGGWHFCVVVQGFSGSGGSRLQPSGLNSVVQTGG